MSVPEPPATGRVATTDLVRISPWAAARRAPRDPVAVEEPLEVRVAGRTVAVTMRTPGDDVALALGFLFSEGIVASIDDVGSVDAQDRADDEGAADRVDVSTAPGRRRRARGVRTRGASATAACGVCGGRRVQDLVARAGLVVDDRRFELAMLLESTERLRAGPPEFGRADVGHCAAVLTPGGRPLVVAQDVGRHNAVDKVVGALLERRAVGANPRGTRPGVLVVSGRASFEVVQRAVVAKIPVLVTVSAPTSLAIRLARACGVTLLGLVGGGGANVYAHPARIDGLAGRRGERRG